MHRRVLGFCGLTLLLAVLTGGAGFAGLVLDPWDGETGGNSPLILLALPLLGVLMSGVGGSAAASWSLACVAQFVACAPIATVLTVGWRVVRGRRLGTAAGPIPDSQH